MNRQPTPDRWIRFKVHGMDCAEEVGILKREVGPLVGGEDNLRFEVLRGIMAISSSLGNGQIQGVMAAVARTGMRAEVINADSDSRSPQPAWARHVRVALTLVSGVLAVAALIAHSLWVGGIGEAIGSEGMGHASAVPFPARILYLGSILAGVYFVFPKALFSLRKIRPDMNLLMVVAVIGAILIGEWFEAATVAFLFSLSLTLETWSVGRARRAIEKLMELAPPTVRVISDDGRIQETHVDEVPVSTRFVVRPGERIGLDGEVLTGTSDVNQAPITGESVPAMKSPGSAVFAGTVNGMGVLEVRSTKEAGETTLARIIALVGDAQQRRAPSEQWVDRFARYYTPTVMVLALAVLLVPTMLLGQPLDRWIYQSLVLLVIACPCALVISTPVSVVAAVAAAARHGVLVKGGEHIESPARLKAIAIDKTGTLTAGIPRVVRVEALNGHSPAELLERAAGMEAHNDHPLAKAITEHTAALGIVARPGESIEAIPGKGIVGVWDGRQFWLGSHRMLEERDQETPEVHDQLESLSASGHTVVVVGNEEHVCGFLALADAIRPEARRAVQEMRALGVEHVVMLTGDNRGTALAIAGQAGVNDVEADLLPEDKVHAVDRLVRRFGYVAMVGDGINDAPAMGRATLGIAMGVSGSDTAIETADIALMSDDLTKLAWLIRHSRRTLSIIRVNIAISLAIKGLFVALTFAGHASLWAAIAADMGVSLTVIANALRLLRPTRAGGY
jgi:Cd2+/Zn2+-exporting ATPase